METARSGNRVVASPGCFVKLRDGQLGLAMAWGVAGGTSPSAAGVRGGCVVVKPQKGPQSSVSRRETRFVMGGAIT